MDGTRSLVSNGELILYGVIDPSDPSGIRAVDVVDSLTQLSNASSITARINSPGGSVIEGIAIFNALRATGKPVTMQIDSMAASAASVVMLAGDDIVMAENASVMIHDPWTLAIGSSDDLRAAADEVDRQKSIIIGMYAQRTGLEPTEITAMMAAETYMSAADAVEKGFATRIEQLPVVNAMAKLEAGQMAKLLMAKPSVTVSLADTRVRAHLPNPAASAAHVKESTMTTAAESGASGGNQTVDLVAIRAEAAKGERDRVHGIYHAVRAAKLDHDFADEMIREGATLAQAHAKVIDKFAETQNARDDNPQGGQRPTSTVVADGQDRWAKGAEQGLAMRAGLVKMDRTNEFAGLSLHELARSSLAIRNERTGGMSRLDMVGRAFTVRGEGPGYNSTSDFPNILQNVAYKAMMKGYTEADETFDQWTGKGTLTDFRPAYRVDSGLFPALDKIDEGAEYKYGTVTDSGTQVVLATYGKMFAITRQAIINDDLDYFNKIPMKMGRASKRTIGNLVYAVLNTNPVMQDGVALFSTAHKNTNAAGMGAGPNAGSISIARIGMARQMDDAGQSTGVGIKPKFILVPPELYDVTNTVLKAEYLSADAGLQPNYVANAATPISDNRLNPAQWFLAADPAVTDTIEVDYLDGNEEPYMEPRQGWTVDGVEYKVRIDASVKALHWRGLYRNTGLGN